MRASQYIMLMDVKSLQNYKLRLDSNIVRPPIQSGVFIFLFLSLMNLFGCGTFGGRSDDKDSANSIKNYREITPIDYAEHLASLKKPFLATSGIRQLQISVISNKYLDKVVAQIINNNEIFFKQLKKGKVTVLDVEAPLHFSLPQGEIFISKGLISKYIKHESILVSILSYELVRSEKLLYTKETLVPTGFVPMEKLIMLNRLSLKEKMEVHKWAFHLTMRSGYDGEYYLSWLQIQNRNTADFIMQVGDVNQINREESLFKAFLIKHSVDDNIITKGSSSKSFYSFLNGIRDGVI